MTDKPDGKAECIGGPNDGDRVSPRGEFWRVMEASWSGTYVQRDGAYYWEGD